MRQIARASVLCLAGLALACSDAVPGVNAGTTPSFSIVAALPPSRAAAPFDTTVTVKGGPRAGVRWSVSGTLPAGVVFNILPTGDLRLFGTPSQSGSFTFTLEADTTDGQHAETALTFVVDPIGQILGDTVQGADTEGYLATLDVLGAPHGQVRWSVASGTLPPGILLIASGIQATLSGISVEGAYSFTLVAADDVGILAQRDFVIAIGPHLSIDPSQLPDATVSLGYSARAFQAAGGSGAGYNWAAGDGLPPGIFFSTDGTAAVFFGAPTTPGTYSFTVTATDSGGAAVQQTATIIVHRNLQLSSAMPGAAAIAAGYTGTLTATGADADVDYQWFVVSGALPPGLSLTTVGGNATVAGTPTQTGFYDFAISVTLPTGESATQFFEIFVQENPPQIVTAALPDGTWSTDYLATVSAQSAVGGPFQWSVTDGSLPPGLALSGADTEQLTFSGKPRFIGTFAFTLAFSDARQSTTASYSLTIGHLDQLEVLAAILGKARVGHAYSAQIEARGATGVVSVAFDRGSFPPGLTLSPDGSIAGSPAAAGNFSFSVVASDATGNTARQQFAIPVAPDLSIAAAATNSGATSSLVTRDLSAATPGPIVPLVTDLAQPVIDLSFSFDPSRFSFVTNEGRSGSLYAVDLNTPSPVVQVASNLTVDHFGAIRWSPDGGRFAYPAELGPGSAEYSHFIVAADDPAASTAAVAGGLPCQFAGLWSPDATVYATAAADGSAIYLSDGSTTRTLPIDGGPRFADVVAWSPDSSLLLVTAQDASGIFRIFALDISADQPAPFPMTPPDAQIFDFAQSDDGGGFAAYAANSDSSIFVTDLRSPQVGPMTQIALAQRTAIGWSPDSRRLAVAGPGPAASSLGVVDRNQLASAVTIADGLSQAFAFTWSPDSQSVIANTFAATFAIPVNGGPPDTLVTGVVDFGSGILPGQPPLFVYSDASGVSSLDLSAPPPRTKVTLDAVPVAHGVSLAPARRAAFYSRFPGTPGTGSIWMIDLNGASPSAPIDVFDFDASFTAYAVSDTKTVFVN